MKKITPNRFVKVRKIWSTHPNEYTEVGLYKASKHYHKYLASMVDNEGKIFIEKIKSFDLWLDTEIGGKL